MAAGGAVCSAAAGRAVDALGHVVNVCVGRDGTASTAALTIACSVSVLCDILPRSRSRPAARGTTLLPVVTAALLLWRYLSAVARLLVGQLLLGVASSRLSQQLPWTVVSLLLAGAEVCWLAARAPVLPVMLFSGVAACLAERCGEWRRRALLNEHFTPPLGAPAVSPSQRPLSLWRFVFHPPNHTEDSTDDPRLRETEDLANITSRPPSLLSACLPLAAVPVLLAVSVLCEWMFPWDALVFHSRTNAVQLLQLVVMWTGLQAVWLCPLVVLQTTADLILR